MPSTIRLGEAHRASQDRLAVALTRVLARTYRRMAPNYQSDPAVAEWLADMVALIGLYRERSALMAEDFYGRIGSMPRGVKGDPLEPEAVATSLRVTGVIGIVDALKHGKTMSQALEQAEGLAKGAADRHALDGGRSLIANAVEADRNALGYYRQTKPGCCSFCAMLASRTFRDGNLIGVFKGDSFDASDPRFIGDGDVKVHDHCHCQLVPIFDRAQDVPGANREFADLWAESTRGYSGDDALNAFRREYEAKFLRNAA